MSTPTPLDSKIITLIVAMFDAAPGAEVLAELRSALTAGESVENLARNLVRTQVFQSLYPDTLGSAEFAARFAQNVLGEEVGFDQQAFATVELTAMQLAGLDRGQVVLRAIEALLAVEPTNPEWGNARRAFENKVIVAEYYSVEKGMSAQTLEALQTVLAPVTSSDRSTLSAIRIIDGLPPLPALTISGTITAGPVVADNGLTVTALSADGQVLGSSVVDANGNYSIALPSAYTGVVLLRVTDSNDRADYVDEATGEAMDLNIDLRAVAVADGRSDLVVNVTPATELVALGLGLAAGDNGSSSTALQGVTALQVASTQTAVQQALGLPENFVSAPVIPAVTAAGEPNAQANLYGNVLAAISGLSITQGRPVGGVLATLSPQVSSGKVSQVTAVDMVGAAVLANANGAAVGSALGMADNQANQVTTAWTNVFSDTTVLSTSDLTALGIPVSDNAQSAALAVALVSSALRTTTTDSAARSVSVLTGLTTAADNVVAAVNGSAVLTLTDLQTLGVRGITEAQVASVAQALTSLGVDRLPTTADELNTVAQQAVTVDGPNVDRTAPVFPDGAGKTVSVAENADTSTVVYDAQATDNGGAADAGITYRLSGTDAAAFAISTAGVVTLNASADFETKARYAIEVIATDATGNATTQTVTINVINVNDAPSGTPSISGTVTEDQTLTAVTTGIDDADGLGAFSYQWLRDGSAISGATSATYTLGDSDVGKAISSEVSYTDGNGTRETLTSTATAAVANVNDAPNGTPGISGAVAENSKLTAVTTGIADADGLGSFSYQWQRGETDIDGATGETYTLGNADIGQNIRVRVRYTDGNGTAESVLSDATAAVTANNAPTGTPGIDGTAIEDQVLTVVTTGIADVDGLGAFSYQWMRGDADIEGATGETYVLGDADVGQTIRVRVSYTDDNGSAESVLSTATAAVANVNDAPSGTPDISGTVAENSTLTAVTTDIADPDGLGSFSYQWVRGTTDIDGATNETYVLVGADVDHTIRVRVSYTDGQGTEESVTSEPTAAVVNVNDAPTGLPIITGTVAKNSTLTVDTNDIDDADGMGDGSFSYQWVRGSTDIDSATGANYVLTDADIGQTIRVRVSYTDGRGTPETLDSAPTAPVADFFNPVIDSLRVASDNIVNGTEQSATVGEVTYQAITGQVRGTLNFDFRAGDRIVALVGGEGGTSVEGTVSADGSFSINVATTVLRDAAAKNVAVTLFSTGSGNTTPEADANASTAYSVDLVAPTVTVAINLTTNDGLTETIANGGLTKDSTVVLSGTAADTGLGVAKVQVYDGATLLGDATLSADRSSWTFTTAALSDGTHALTAVAEDSAGNRSAASSAFSFTVDATGPTITTAATAYVLENASALLVPTGTDARAFSWSLVAKEGDDSDKLHLEPGSIPDVRLNTGSLDYESGKTAYQFTLRATDVAGNATDKDFTVNVLDVPEVTVGDLKFGDGTDAVVNIAESAGATITLSGKITATGSYESAQIAIYPADGDQPLDQPVLVNADGTFSVELDTELVLSDPDSVLVWTVTLAFVDSQGVTHTNVQTSGESDYVVDTTAPDASLASLSVTPDNTINAVEMTAAQAGGTVTVTGTVGGTDFAVGDTVTVKVNERLFTGNVLDGTGRFAIEVDGSAIVAAAGADRSVTITISDAAGNTDEATTTFVVDITGPVISTTGTQRVDEGSGNLLYTATASDAGGGTVTFSLLGTDEDKLNVGSDGRITLKGAATLDHETQDSYSFTLRASDSVGNHTDQAVTVTVVDVPEFAIASATLAGDNIINLAESTPPAEGQARVSLLGQLSGEFAGARVYADGDGMDPYETTVATDGRFEIRLPVGELTAQTTKQVQLEARVVYTNAAGSTVTAMVNLVLPYSIDTIAPVGNLQDISLATDNILNAAESAATSVLLSGSVSGEFTVGNTVKVTVGTSVVDGTLDANGHFSIPVNTTALLEATIDGAGSLSIEVLATDAAGNSAPYTQTLSYTVDTTAPVVSAIAVAYSDATDTSATVSGSVSGATAGATVLLQVFTEAGAAVGEALPTTLGDGGSFSVALPTTLAAGSYRVQATVQDAAGNTAQPSSDLFTHNPLSVAEDSNTGTAVEDGATLGGHLSLSALTGGTLAAAVEGSYAGRLGTLVMAAGNAWTYTLNAEAQKLGQDVKDIDTISVTLADGRSISFALTVRGVNDAPTAANAEVDDVEEGVSSGFDLPLAIDPDTGDTVTYSLARQARHGTVEISGSADYTYTPTGDFFGEDSFTYTVSDGKGGSNTYTVTLNVTDDGEPIVVSVSDEDTLTVFEGTPVSVGLEVTEMVGTVTWTVSDSAAALGFRMEDNFLIADSAPEYDDLEPVDGSAYRQVSITVDARDERGQSVEKVITLLVANDALVDDQAPVFPDGASKTVSVAENAPISTVVYDAQATDNGGAADAGITYSLGGTDAAAFAISAAGEVTLNNSADFEAKASYTIEVTATDAVGNASTQSVTVNVTDVDEVAPVFPDGASKTVSVAENAPISTVVYDAQATDNGGAADAGITYSLGGTDAAAFAISAAGEVTLNNSADFEAKASYAIEVTATDAAGNASTQTVTVNVTDADEVAPVFTNGATASASVAENAPISTVVYDAQATDNGGAADAGITYSLGGTDAAAFAISAAGEVTLTNSADFEAKASYAIEVIATDAAGNATTQTVTVNVINLNDAPSGTPTISGTAEENSTLTAITSGISDADGLGTFSYQWLRDGSAISGATNATYTLGDADVGKAIRVRVDYTDARGTPETLTSAATAAVVNVNDAPAPTPQTVSGSEDDTSITGNLLFAEAESPYPFDPDGDALLVSRIAFGSGSPVDVAEGSTATELPGNYGNLSIGADGEFEYTPDDRADALAGGATASEIFTYTVVDSHGATGSSTFTVALTGVNDAPIAVNDTNVATEAGGTSTASTGVVNAAGNVITGRRGAIGSTSFAGTDSDPDSTTLTVASFRSTIASTEQSAGATTGGSHGRLTLNGTGEYTYSPYTNTGTSVDIPTTNALEAGATSTDSFTYTLSDGSSTSTATLVITVTGSDDAIFLSGTGTRSSVSAESGSGPVALDDSGDSLDDITLTAWELSDQNSANAWTYTVSIGATDRHASDTLTMSWEGGTDPEGVFDAVWNASTFVLTVTPKSGVSAETALVHRDRVFAAVQFETGDEATTGERTISYAVKAADSAGGLLSNTVTQTVDVTNDSGILASGSGSTPENVAYDTTLSLTGATGTVTWTKLAGEDSERFSLDNNVLTLAAQDFESPADIDSNNVYRVRVQVQGVDSGSAGTVTGWISVLVTNANDAPVGLPSISGTVTEDQTLSAVTSGISDADGLGDFSYQWLRDGSAISGATGTSYTLGDADVGKAISVRANYTDGGGTAETLTSLATANAANVNDTPVGLPAIGGTATEDQTLTAVTSGISDADGLGTFSYQWVRGSTDIEGATGETYTLGDADVGQTLRVRVSYTDAKGTPENLTSDPTAAVANVNDTPVGLPTITGTATEDQTLTAVTSGINDADGPGTFSYQWLRDGSAISGATGTSYTMGDADVGNAISVRVSYTDAGGTAETLTSAATASVANVNDTPVGLPTITGTVSEGQELTADTSSFSDADGKGSFSYQWLRAGVAISGATNATYTLVSADVGTAISVRVSYTDLHGTAESLTSLATAAVANVNDTPVGLPTIGGTATEDQTLTAVTSTISDGDGLGAFSCQWLRDGSAISGATGTSYTLGDADVGKSISVRVNYTDLGGTAESLTSLATANVANVNDTPVGLPAIGGTVTEDQTLTASTSGIGDADGLGTFSYQWLRAGTAISGATSATYKLGDADVGQQVSVRVNYTDGHGSAESLTSTATTAVVNINDVPVQTLAANNSDPTGRVAGWTGVVQTPVTVTFDDILNRSVAQGLLSDADGISDIVAFRVTAVNANTTSFKINGVSYDNTSVRSTVALITSEHSAIWTPSAAQAAGFTNVIRVVAIDAAGTSANPNITRTNTFNDIEAPKAAAIRIQMTATSSLALSVTTESDGSAALAISDGLDPWANGGTDGSLQFAAEEALVGIAGWQTVGTFSDMAG